MVQNLLTRLKTMIKNRLDPIETCVSCRDTIKPHILKSTPVEERHHYIEGSGQLCRECWILLYEDTRRKHPRYGYE